MGDNRRNFLKKAPLLAASPVLLHQLLACQSKPADNTIVEDTPAVKEPEIIKASIEKFGIQLWTVKEDMAKDPKATLKELAAQGYKYIESFQGEKGIFWGMPPKDFAKFLSDNGLQCISSHCDPAYTTDASKSAEFNKLVEDAATVGIKFLLNPFPGELKLKDEWMAVANGLNAQGKISNAAGIRSGYHNHHLEFMPLADGTLPMQLLLDNTNREYVDFELDLYWCVKAGQDPEKWFTNNTGRFRLCHVKDLYKEEAFKEIEKSEKSESTFWPVGASTFLGNGRIDFQKVLATAQQNGMEYFIVEQERFDNSTPLQDTRKNAVYMSQFAV